MTLSDNEVRALLDHRRYDAKTVLDDYVKFEDSYADWNDRVELVDTIARGEWEMVWPDHHRDRALPKVPNYVNMAATHRARLFC